MQNKSGKENNLFKVRLWYIDLKKKIKESKILRDKIYLTALIKKIINYRNNVKYEAFVKRCENLDLFSGKDMDEFRIIVSEIKNYKASGLRLKRTESFLYGHINALFDYAGIEKINELSLPAIRHGVEVKPAVAVVWPNALTHNVNYVLLCDINRKAIRNYAPFAPIFMVGPIIHYALPFYSEERQCEIKKKLGRCLLFFTAHATAVTHLDNNNDDEMRISEFYDKYKKEFDTILVCAFWCDIEQPIFKSLESKGAVLVTAGLQGDPNFIRRLKSIISLADVVVSDTLGTHIGYSLCMNKPFRMISRVSSCDKTRWNAQRLESTEKVESELWELFGEVEYKITQEQLNYIESFWGLQNIKTKEEMKAIIEVSNYLLKESKGSMSRYMKNTQRIKALLDTGDFHALPKLHSRLLEEALE